jgi:hypothetical protein
MAKKKKKDETNQHMGWPLYFAVVSNLEGYKNFIEPGVRLFFTRESAEGWAADVIRTHDSEWESQIAPNEPTNDSDVISAFQTNLSGGEVFAVMEVKPAKREAGR